MSAPVLELRDLWLSRGGRPVLEGVDLVIEERDYLAILGPNGGGKSSLLRVILGTLRPDRGSVSVLGQAPSQAQGRVGFVPQSADFDLDFPIRVRDVVLMGRLGRGRLLRRFSSRDRRLAGAALEKLEIADLAELPIGRISDGQRQRVLIARALAMEPELLLLDEPAASLDERMGQGLWQILDDLAREMSLILVSHDIGAISRHVRSVACLNRRLYLHESRELTPEILEASYGCPVDLIAHGHPHRVLGEHEPA